MQFGAGRCFERRFLLRVFDASADREVVLMMAQLVKRKGNGSHWLDAEDVLWTAPAIDRSLDVPDHL